MVHRDSMLWDIKCLETMWKKNHQPMMSSDGREVRLFKVDDSYKRFVKCKYCKSLYSNIVEIEKSPGCTKNKKKDKENKENI